MPNRCVRLKSAQALRSMFKLKPGIALTGPCTLADTVGVRFNLVFVRESHRYTDTGAASNSCQ